MWRRFPSDHFSPSAAVARSQGRSLKEQILATRPRSRLHWRPYSLLSPIAQRGFVAITKFIFVRVFHTVLNRPAVAQSPQPRDIRRHALDWITHCPERLERPPINPKRQFLAARLPPPRMRPVINLRRTQRFSAARYESALLRNCTGPRPLDGVGGRLRRLRWCGHFIGGQGSPRMATDYVALYRPPLKRPSMGLFERINRGNVLSLSDLLCCVNSRQEGKVTNGF
jgi:hypothetical protein